MRYMNKPCIVALIALVGIAIPALASVQGDFQKSEQAWRDGRVKRLTSPSGWLTLVGLHWLQPGENVFGSDPDCAIPLPAGKAPKRSGVLVLDAGMPEEGDRQRFGGRPKLGGRLVPSERFVELLDQEMHDTVLAE